jgi:transcriptional regulator with XRE-family HTH domain
MNTPRATQLLRGMQIEFQYLLNKHLNDNGLTVEQVAEAAGVSVPIVKQLAAGTYTGLLSYLFAVSLAIGKAPSISLTPVEPTA